MGPQLSLMLKSSEWRRVQTLDAVVIAHYSLAIVGTGHAIRKLPHTYRTM